MVTLEMVKNALGIVGDYQDATLTVYLNEVMDFLKDSGVAEANITAGLLPGACRICGTTVPGTGKVVHLFHAARRTVGI